MKKFLSLLLAITMVMSAMMIVPAVADEGEKVIIAAIADDPQQMDPTLNSYARSSKVLQNLFKGLYAMAPDGTYVPAMAESCEISEDGLTYTFTMRDGVLWSDGSAVTAKDFEYSWIRVLTPEVASKAASDLWVLKNGKAYYNGECDASEVGVSAPDEKTFIVELEQPAPWFLSLTATTSFFPVKQEVVEAEESWTLGTYDTTYISNGPFMLEKYASLDELVMVKNPNYYAADTVKIDKVVYKIIADSATELTAYNNGEINMLGLENGVSADAMNQYGATDEYAYESKIGIWYCDFNCQLPEFSDPNVRTAFSISIDRAAILTALQINGTPAFGFVPDAQPSLTEPSKSYREIAGDMFAEDVERAKQLMADAGYPNGEGFPTVTIRMQSNNTQSLFAQILKATWEQNLGVTCDIQMTESGYWDELDAGNFSVDRNGYTVDFVDASANLKIWTTGSNAYENGWDDAAYDELYNAAMACTDDAEREAGLIAAEQYLVSQMPGMPIYTLRTEYLVKPEITGVVANKIGHFYFEFADIA